MKRHCIKIVATLLIPYDPDAWGETGKAEQAALDLEKDIAGRAGIMVESWQAKKARVDFTP